MLFDTMVITLTKEILEEEWERNVYKDKMDQKVSWRILKRKKKMVLMFYHAMLRAKEHEKMGQHLRGSKRGRVYRVRGHFVSVPISDKE